MNDFVFEFEKRIMNMNLDFETVKDASLSKYTSFRTGGNSFVFAPKNIDALIAGLQIIKELKIKFFILGNGTNVLAKDDGFDGIIVLLTKLASFSVSENRITASCGIGFTKLSTIALDNSLSGLEFAYGIPGTLGGAVFMNAGAYDGEISFVTESVTAILPDGEIKTFSKDECEFGYRSSVFQKNGAIVIEATLLLKFGNKEEISSKMNDFIRKRKEKQPLEFPSAGSTFKRLPNYFTAKLIDEVGLKGKRIGGAMVSEKHAGFIINFDNATSNDILELILLVQKTVKSKTGESIQTEIRIIE